MVEFLTLDDVDVKNKTVLIRVDINVPYNEETGKIVDSDRLKEHAKTIKELSDKEAKIVILSHQGRRGNADFIHLDQHAKLLTNHVGCEVEFFHDIIGEVVKEKIRSLESGEIILLDNVRFLEDEAVDKKPEEHKNSSLVRNLSPLSDVFVNDAFSAAHRSHASIVGFTTQLPSYAGRVIEREVEQLKGILTTMEISEHDSFVLGGAKPRDTLDIIDFMLERGVLERILVSGVVGELFLIAEGYKLGSTEDFLRKKNYTESLPQTEELLKKYGEKIEIPLDVAMETSGKRAEISVEDLPSDFIISDIGRRTIERYVEVINESVTIGFKGPTGKYEKEEFGVGTRVILRTIANSKAKTLVGGGHTLAALDKFNIDRDKFTHVSLGGGALIKYLSGKPMPAIEALKEAAKK